MAKRDTTVRRRESLFREAAAVIERDYAQDLDLTAVAHRVATSRRQLQRAFQEVGRTTFRTYLGEVRMRNAAQLLRQGGMPVREVAMRVGYSQPAQFAKAFRRYHGASPSSLRHGGRQLAA
jgi:AraC family transcriptional regulator, regulatory protein of adaptative response / methylphosphotriester-DNA alkyltransferase methyltransferase